MSVYAARRLSCPLPRVSRVIKGDMQWMKRRWLASAATPSDNFFPMDPVPLRSALSSTVVQSAREKLSIPTEIEDSVLDTGSEPISKAALKDELRLNAPPLSDAKLDVGQAQLIFESAWRNLVSKYGSSCVLCPPDAA
jgi:hypothetical protein